MKTAEQQIQQFKEEVTKQVANYNTRKALILEQSRVLFYLTELNHKLWRTEEEAPDEKEEVTQKEAEVQKESSHQEEVSDYKKKAK